MKIFISGRISGINKKIAEGLFEQAEKFLADQGHTPINPMRMATIEGDSDDDNAVARIRHLFSCEAIFMLPNWGQCREARIQYQIAREMALKVLFQDFPGPITLLEQK